MSAPPPIFANELFETKAAGDFAQRVRVIKKSGEAWLVLPESAKLAAQALSLYPAQTRFAKTARAILGAGLRVRMPFGWHWAETAFSREDSFVRFLQQLMSKRGTEYPPFAILAGNPKGAGRRYVVLLFDDAGDPAVVVKAGVGDESRQLVKKENLFLRSVTAGKGLPKIRSAFSSGRVEALAMDYVAGTSPGVKDWAGVGTLLSSWVNRDKRVNAEEITIWQRVGRLHGRDADFQKISESVRDFEFNTTLYHGDFAPWNIKVSAGNWTALDWERGELRGFPGWDWFHYVVQYGILVGKRLPKEIADEVEKLLASEAFCEYAKLTGIAGREKSFFAAYVFYCAKVLRPTEGLDSVENLLRLVVERGWK